LESSLGFDFLRFARRVQNNLVRSTAKRRNVVFSLPGLGLDYPRFVFQAHCLPHFSKALPPENPAMPLFGKPGFVTISFRHNSLLCEPITSIILDRAASRRSADLMLTLQILAGR
jgi:hypothetical protein